MKYAVRPAEPGWFYVGRPVTHEVVDESGKEIAHGTDRNDAVVKAVSVLLKTDPETTAAEEVYLGIRGRRANELAKAILYGEDIP